MSKLTRYDGQRPEVKKLVSSSKADKTKLINWLAECERIQGQIDEADRLNETLPNEIDKLLKSGVMDNATVENLARKRAWLDLLPSRMEHLNNLMDKHCGEDFAAASELIEATVRRASVEYYDLQLKQAVADLMQLGVDEDVANRQAIIREDIQLIQPMSISGLSSFGPITRRVRSLLWCFEAFEVGLHPRSPEAKKIEQQLNPEK